MVSKKDGVSRRLSKPRSINSSSSALLDIWDHTPDGSSPLSSSDVDYFGQGGSEASKSSSSRRRSKSKSRSKLRAYLTGSQDGASQALASDEPGESNKSPSSAATVKARKRWSKSKSVIAMSHSTMTSSADLLNGSSRSTDNEATEDTVAIAEQIKQRAQHDSLAADNHVLSFPDDDEQNEILVPPVRRKSLYTPGLATRNVSDILRKPPANTAPSSPRKISEADRDYYYNQSHPESSPLARLAALKLSDEGGRATPTSLNVPNLGGLKLGTLRVTNGSQCSLTRLSRTQSMSAVSISESADHDDYQTASEGGCDKEQVPDHPEIQQSPSTTTKFAEPPSNRAVQPSSKGEAGPEAASLEQNVCASMHACAYIAEIQDSLPDAFDTMDSPDSTHFEGDVDKGSQIYRTYTEARKPSTGLLGNKVIDSCFGNSKSHVRLESSSLPRRGPTEAFSVPAGALCKQSDDCRDSGYHSNDSSHDSIKQVEPCLYDDRHLVQLSNVQTDSQMNTKEAKYAGNPRNTNRKLQKTRPLSRPPLQALNSFDELHEISGADIPRVPSAMALKHAERLLNFPVLEHTYPSLDHVSVRQRVANFERDFIPIRFPSPFKRSEQLKLSLLPSASLSPMDGTGTSPDLDESSPETAKPRKQLKDIMRSPSWGSQSANKIKTEQKKLVKKVEEERRRALKEEQDRRKQLESEQKEVERKARRQEAIDKILRLRNPSARGKSADGRSQYLDDGEMISDLGTVAQSLGGSPYDIATSMNPHRPRRSSSIHPHQLGAAGHRPRSFVGMDDATASEFAQARSRARRQMYENQCAQSGSFQRRPLSNSPHRPRPQTYYGAQEVARKPVPRARASSGERPQSWSGISLDEPSRLKSEVPFNDRGGIPGKLLRASGDYSDAPPIPAMPRSATTPLRTRAKSLYEPKNDPNAAECSLSGYHDRQEEPSFRPRGAQHGHSPVRDGQDWFAQRAAWSERRKSAGAALMASQRPEDGQPLRNTIRAINIGI